MGSQRKTRQEKKKEGKTKNGEGGREEGREGGRGESAHLGDLLVELAVDAVDVLHDLRDFGDGHVGVEVCGQLRGGEEGREGGREGGRGERRAGDGCGVLGCDYLTGHRIDSDTLR